MYKVKQLYVDVSDDDGRTYLIKREDIGAFKKEWNLPIIHAVGKRIV